MKMRGKTNFADRTLRFVKRSLFLVLALSVAIFSLLALFLANQSASTIRAVSKMYMSGLNEQISAHFETAISLRLDQLEVLARDVPSPGIHTDEEERAELIDGQMFRMDSPELAHQDILGELHVVVREYIRNHSGKCKVFFSPFAVYINNDIYNYVEPDLLVICDMDKLDRKGCHGAPDWLVEIVSPGSKKMDYIRKLFKYRTAGVREYWIIDPMKKMIKVYDFGRDTETDYTFEDKVPVGIYEDFVIDFAAFDQSFWE